MITHMSEHGFNRDDLIEDLLNSLDLMVYIRDHVVREMRRKDNRFRMMCPLCGDGSERFFADGERQTWKSKCCDQSGTVVTLDMLIRGGTFMEAVTRLSSEYRIV